ncbi:MAG: hypothetical protein OHK0018_15490 [Erythrobacter tepidarius]
MSAPEFYRRPARAIDRADAGHGPILLVDILRGVNEFGTELASALARRVAVTVLTLVSAPLSDAAGVRLVRTFPEYWGSRNKFAKALQMLRAVLRLTVEVWRHRSTAVHIQFFRLQFVDPVVYLLLRAFVRRLVYTAHNALPHEPRWWHRSFYKAWYRLPDRIHVLSRYTRDRLVSELDVPASKITVVPHGNYESVASRYASSPSPQRESLGIPSNAFVILFFGLIRPYKGVDRLIRAVGAVRSDVPVFLLIAGGGTATALDEVRRGLAAYQLTECSLFDARFIPEGELVAYLKMADLVALPYSHIYQEAVSHA